MKTWSITGSFVVVLTVFFASLGLGLRYVLLKALLPGVALVLLAALLTGVVVRLGIQSLELWLPVRQAPHEGKRD